DHEGLAEPLAELLRYRACRRVDAAARRDVDDDPCATLRIARSLLRRRGEGGEDGKRHAYRCDGLHSLTPACVSRAQCSAAGALAGSKGPSAAVRCRIGTAQSSVFLAVPSQRCTASRGAVRAEFALSSGCAKLLAFGLEHVVQ